MRQVVNTFEYSVAPEHIDFQGHATVPSICGSIINAIGQNIRKEGCGIDVMRDAGRSWVLLRSAALPTTGVSGSPTPRARRLAEERPNGA